jgi:uncharacterized OsmC-like protein
MRRGRLISKFSLRKEAMQITDLDMDRDQLRAIQVPIKQRYLTDPASALVTLRAEGDLGENVTCSIGTGRALIEAGLHPATGGNGLSACSGDMLLQALVACAGVTLGAVATALGIELNGGIVTAEGDLDFRGTFGVAKDVPVGFSRDAEPLRQFFDGKPGLVSQKQGKQMPLPKSDSIDLGLSG